jgi:hypothetical protein
MFYLGLDYHKRYSFATIIDDEGNKKISKKVLNRNQWHQVAKPVDHILTKISNKKQRIATDCNIYGFCLEHLPRNEVSPVRLRQLAH